MGLFDKVLFKETAPVSLNKQEAIAAIGVAAVAADGQISQEEVDRIVIDLATMKLFRRSDMRDLGNTLNKVAGLIKRRGTGPVVQAAKTILEREQAETAFFLATDLVCADGVVEPEEKKFLEELQGTLQIDEQVATKIVEVALIKNRG